MEQYNKIVKSSNFIQILEYFGFDNSENAEENTLENLFINYTNDKLSNLLFEISIKNEAELYLNEGIISQDYMKNILSKNKETDKTIVNNPRTSHRGSITKLNINKNNQDIDIEGTILSCEDNSKGIFKLLDVQSSISMGSLKALCDNIKLSWPNIITTNNSFYLQHFGQVVEYGASDFIQKNIDSINDDLKEISTKIFMEMTDKLNIDIFIKNKLTKKLGIIPSEKKTSSPIKTLPKKPESNRRVSQNMKLISNSEKFKQKINQLILSIKKTDITFIKLIKTSKNKEINDNFDDKYVLKQIYSSGILESVLLANGGFFLRYPYDKLKKELSIFNCFKTYQSDEEFNKILANFLNISKDDFVLGKSLIFLKNSALQKNRELLNFSNISSVVKRKLLNSIFKKVYFTNKVFVTFLFIMNKNKYMNFHKIINKCLDSAKIKYFYLVLNQSLQIKKYMLNKIKKNIWLHINHNKFKRLKALQKVITNTLVIKLRSVTQNYLIKILKLNFLHEKKLDSIKRLFILKLKKIKITKKITRVILKCNNCFIFNQIHTLFQKYLLKKRIVNTMISTYRFRKFGSYLVKKTQLTSQIWTFLFMKRKFYLKMCIKIYYLLRIRQNFSKFQNIIINSVKIEKAFHYLEHKFLSYFFKEIKIEMRLFYRSKKMIANFISISSRKIKASKKIYYLYDRICFSNYIRELKICSLIYNLKAKLITRFLRKSTKKLQLSKRIFAIVEHSHANFLFSLFYSNLRLKYFHILNKSAKKITDFLRKTCKKILFINKLSSSFNKKIYQNFFHLIKQKVEKLMFSAWLITKFLREFSHKSKSAKKLNLILISCINRHNSYCLNILNYVCYRISKARQIIKFLNNSRNKLKFSKILKKNLDNCLKGIFISSVIALKAFFYLKINSSRKIKRFFKNCKDLLIKTKRFYQVFSRVIVRKKQSIFFNNIINLKNSFINIEKACEIFIKLMFLSRAFNKIYFKSCEILIKNALFKFILKSRRNKLVLKIYEKINFLMLSKLKAILKAFINRCYLKIKHFIFIKKTTIYQIKLYTLKRIDTKSVIKAILLKRTKRLLIDFINSLRKKILLIKKLQKSSLDFLKRIKRHRLLLKIQALICRLKRKNINFKLRQIGMLLQLDHERMIFLKNEENNLVEPNKDSQITIAINTKSSNKDKKLINSSQKLVQIRTNSINKASSKIENKSSTKNSTKTPITIPVSNNNNNNIKKVSGLKPKIPIPSNNLEEKKSPKKSLLPPVDNKLNAKTNEENSQTRTNSRSKIVKTNTTLVKSSSKAKINVPNQYLSLEKNPKNVKKSSLITSEVSNTNIKNSLLKRSNSSSNTKDPTNIIKACIILDLESMTLVKKHKSVNLQKFRQSFSHSFDELINRETRDHIPSKKLNSSSQNIETKHTLNEGDVLEKHLKPVKKNLKKPSLIESQKKAELNKMKKKVKDCDKDIELLELELNAFTKAGSLNLKDEYENNKSKFKLILEKIEEIAKNQKQKHGSRKDLNKNLDPDINFK